MSEETKGSGISNRWAAKEERLDYERIMKNYRPRGTHTLGQMFKQNIKKTSND